MRQHKRPYRYALNKRERPRDAKLFYGITENKKSANEHLTQTMWKLVFTSSGKFDIITVVKRRREDYEMSILCRRKYEGN
jgi:hypothetical protein